MERTEEFGLGTMIKENRKNLGISQNDLADLLYTERTAISKWENGVNLPPLDKLPDLCSVLKIEPNDLFSNMVNIQQIRRERAMQREKEQNNDKIQHFNNQTEAFGGFRAIVMEREEVEEGFLEEESKICIKEWLINNEFLFLYNTTTDEIEGIRSFENGLFPEKYLFTTEYIPVSYTWMLTMLSGEKASRGRVLSSREEDEILEAEIIKAVTECRKELDRYREVSKKNAEENKGLTVFLLTRQLYDDYLGYCEETKQYLDVNRYKIVKEDFEVSDMDGNPVDSATVNIFIPSSDFIHDVGLCISETILSHSQYWNEKVFAGEYQLPKSVSNVKELTASWDEKLKGSVDAERIIQHFYIVVKRLMEEEYNPYMVKDILQEFQMRLHRISTLSDIGAPAVIMANEIRILGEKIDGLEAALDRSERYIKAEETWQLKLGTNAEERLLETIFGETNNERRINIPRPDHISKEDAVKAEERFQELCKKDHDSDEWIFADSYHRRMMEALFCADHNGTQSFKWCLYQIYDELKENDLKDVITFILPKRICMAVRNGKVDGLSEEMKYGCLRQYVNFRRGIDEIERGGVA